MFSVYDYLERIEKASLDILDSVGPIDKTITLWWGFDGIQLSTDGTYKWVSRKKKPVENVFYQPCQSIQWTMPFESGTLRYGFTDQTQSTRAQIDALMAQCTEQQIQSRKREQIVSALQQCCAQYPLYYYGGCCGNYIG